MRELMPPEIPNTYSVAEQSAFDEHEAARTVLAEARDAYFKECLALRAAQRASGQEDVDGFRRRTPAQNARIEACAERVDETRELYEKAGAAEIAARPHNRGRRRRTSPPVTIREGR